MFQPLYGEVITFFKSIILGENATLKNEVCFKNQFKHKSAHII
jgi:hypothetical protein